MTYKLGYSRLYNLGNYEHEEITLTREFPDEMPSENALAQLQEEVKGLHEKSEEFQNEVEEAKARHTEIASYEMALEGTLADLNVHIERVALLKQKIEKLQAEENPTAAAAPHE